MTPSDRWRVLRAAQDYGEACEERVLATTPEDRIEANRIATKRFLRLHELLDQLKEAR